MTEQWQDRVGRSARSSSKRATVPTYMDSKVKDAPALPIQVARMLAQLESVGAARHLLARLEDSERQLQALKLQRPRGNQRQTRARSCRRRAGAHRLSGRCHTRTGSAPPAAGNTETPRSKCPCPPLNWEKGEQDGEIAEIESLTTCADAALMKSEWLLNELSYLNLSDDEMSPEPREVLPLSDKEVTAVRPLASEEDLPYLEPEAELPPSQIDKKIHLLKELLWKDSFECEKPLSPRSDLSADHFGTATAYGCSLATTSSSLPWDTRESISLGSSDQCSHDGEDLKKYRICFPTQTRTFDSPVLRSCSHPEQSTGVEFERTVARHWSLPAPPAWALRPEAAPQPTTSFRPTVTRAASPSATSQPPRTPRMPLRVLSPCTPRVASSTPRAAWPFPANSEKLHTLSLTPGAPSPTPGVPSPPVVVRTVSSQALAQPLGQPPRKAMWASVAVTNVYHVLYVF